MKVVILAGGLGTRLSEETTIKPKPMVEIGGMPILWHILKIYSHHGLNDFIICLGYKGYMIKEYFANYFLHMSDVTFDMSRNHMQVHKNLAEPWRVTLVNTGDDAATGGRIKRVAHYLDPDEPFCMTYGDGVANIDVAKVVAFHRAQGRLATVSAVLPPGRFGVLDIQHDQVAMIEEKPRGEGGWINGGFFVLSPKVLDYIPDHREAWEQSSMPRLAAEGQLAAYRHHGFWHPMDTMRDKSYLEGLWESGKAPWKVWA